MNHSELQKLASERKQYSTIIAWSVNPRPTLCKVILWDLTHILCWNFQNIMSTCVSNCDIFLKKIYCLQYCLLQQQSSVLQWLGLIWSVKCDVQLWFYDFKICFYFIVELFYDMTSNGTRNARIPAFLYVSRIKQHLKIRGRQLLIRMYMNKSA